MESSVMVVMAVICFAQGAMSQDDREKTQLDILQTQMQMVLSKLDNWENDVCERKEAEKESHPRLDCLDIKSADPDAVSGIYNIKLKNGSLSLRVYCDMTTDDGGWLVFQRRKDGSENFYRNWAQYKRGFGKLDGEFWLGNDALHLLTHQRHYEVRIDLEGFGNERAYALYSNFSVDSPENLYTLSLGTYSGTAGDSLSFQKNHNFSTFDAEHDTSRTRNCAAKYKGGWWYGSCHTSNLNGMYLGEHGRGEYGIIWRAFKGPFTSMKLTEMKIRPSREEDLQKPFHFGDL